jgi:surface antigen
MCGAMTSTQVCGCPGTTAGGINVRKIRAAVVAMSGEFAIPNILHNDNRCPAEKAEKVAISFGAAGSDIHTTAAANSFLSLAVVAATTTRGSTAMRAVSAGMVSVRTACPTGKSCQKVAISSCQLNPIFQCKPFSFTDQNYCINSLESLITCSIFHNTSMTPSHTNSLKIFT